VQEVRGRGVRNGETGTRIGKAGPRTAQIQCAATLMTHERLAAWTVSGAVCILLGVEAVGCQARCFSLVALGADWDERTWACRRRFVAAAIMIEVGILSALSVSAPSSHRGRVVELLTW